MNTPRTKMDEITYIERLTQLEGEKKQIMLEIKALKKQASEDGVETKYSNRAFQEIKAELKTGPYEREVIDEIKEQIKANQFLFNKIDFIFNSMDERAKTERKEGYELGEKYPEIRRPRDVVEKSNIPTMYAEDFTDEDKEKNQKMFEKFTKNEELYKNASKLTRERELQKRNTPDNPYSETDEEFFRNTGRENPDA